MGDIGLLALPPGGLGRLESVRASGDYFRGGRPEARTYLAYHGSPARILGGVMQQGADRLVLRRSVIKCDGGHAKQVGDVGDVGALAQLPRVNFAGIDKSGGKAGGHLHGYFLSLRRTPAFAIALWSCPRTSFVLCQQKAPYPPRVPPLLACCGSMRSFRMDTYQTDRKSVV